MADLRWEVREGDSRDLLRAMPDASVDAIVCDPPYELGFMGKSWDASGIAYSVPLWTEALRVLKPGGHLLAFGGSRTYHRLAVAIEDAGFQIRDSLVWIYGSGFPKSLDISKGIDKAAGIPPDSVTVNASGSLGGFGKAGWNPTPRVLHYNGPKTSDAQAWSGWGTALKPAQEPIVMARKPLAGTIVETVLRYGTGAINVDGCRIPHAGADDLAAHARGVAAIKAKGGSMEGSWKNSSDLSGANDVSAAGRWPANVLLSHAEKCGDGCAEGCAEGCPVAEMDRQSGTLKSGAKRGGAYARSLGVHDGGQRLDGLACYADSGGASRFFYAAKASARERDAGLGHLPTRAGHEVCDREEGSAGANNPRAGTRGPRANVHPTVKPIAIMRYLVRLVTPPGGLVLDPFAGSGTTGCAAVIEGARFLGLELSPEYAEIARARIAHWAPKQEALWPDHASA